jgi:chemotaxis protein methyltransferase CheR
MSNFLDDTHFQKFRDLIYEASGIHFSSSNRSILESRLRERLRVAGVETLSDYYNRIRKDDEELKVLLDSVTTNLTRFFRNTSHIETFEKFVVPEVVERKRKSGGDRSFRLWSAGCSTGEEPYTLAMVALEQLPPGFTLEIVASDISLKSLMIAKEGYYPETRVQGVPQHLLDKYFTKRNGGYQVSEQLKQVIRFDYHNLKHDSGLRGLDAVFCRNVLIYFDEAAQKAAVGRFWDAMGPHSYLFIGHSESLFGMNTGFEFFRTDWACIYRKKVGSP